MTISIATTLVVLQIDNNNKHRDLEDWILQVLALLQVQAHACHHYSFLGTTHQQDILQLFHNH